MGGTVLLGMEGAGLVGAGVSILAGLAVCFFGCRLVRVVLAIAGFVVGILLGYLLAGFLGASGSAVWIVALVCGIVCGSLATAVYKVGVFLLGAVAGWLLGGMIGTHLGGSLPVIVPLAAALLVGLLAVASQRIVVTLATALSGSWLAVRAGAALLAGKSVALTDLIDGALAPGSWEAASLGFFAAWGVLALAGALVQLRRRR